jgi:hypothetical protein
LDPAAQVTESFCAIDGNTISHTDTNGVIRDYDFDTNSDNAMLCNTVTVDLENLNIQNTYQYNFGAPLSGIADEHRCVTALRPLGNKDTTSYVNYQAYYK